MRRQRRISEFGEAEFLGASFHDAPQSARQSLAALPDHRPEIPNWLLCSEATFAF